VIFSSFGCNEINQLRYMNPACMASCHTYQNNQLGPN